MSGIRKKTEQTKKEFINLFLALIDLVDFTKAAKMIVEKIDYLDQFLDIERICSQQKRETERELMI